MSTRSALRHHILFTVLILLGAAIYSPPIHSLAKLLFTNEVYSHIAFIPAVTLFFILLQRKTIFSETNPAPVPGMTLIGAGLAVYGAAILLRDRLYGPAFLNQEVSDDYLTLCMAAGVAWVIGSFLAVYGSNAFKQARFQLLFLLLAIPLPMSLLNPLVTSLQHASAEAADVILGLSGVSYYRNGLVFEFSNVTIRVAEVCSGIRSSLSLFVLSIVAGYLFLRGSKHRLMLALSVFPVTVFKNAFRIVTITLLANYVDTRFLTGHWIHRSGGMLFLAASIVMFIPIVWGLRRNERARAGAWRQTQSMK